MNDNNISNILILGNGFDIHHGYKTKYSDFLTKLDYIIDTQKQEDEILYTVIKNNDYIKYFLECNARKNSWIDLEKEIENITRSFTLLFEFYEKNYGEGKSFDIDSKFFSLEDYYLFEFFDSIFRINKNNNNYTQFALKTEYKYKNYIYNKKAILKALREQLNDLIKAVYIYIKYYAMESGQITLSDQIKKINPDYVINFNYTDTISKYGIEKEKVTYIHGNLDNEESLILGTRETENTDFIYFTKFFQRLQKRTDIVNFQPAYKNINGITAEIKLHIFGHSIDNTDGDIFRRAWSIVNEVFIYYYDQDDYEAKIINLFNVFGNKKIIEDIEKGFIKFIEIK